MDQGHLAMQVNQRKQGGAFFTIFKNKQIGLKLLDICIEILFALLEIESIDYFQRHSFHNHLL